MNEELEKWVDKARAACQGYEGGAATSDMLECIWELVKPGDRTLETGSGLTTGVFLAKAEVHIAIDPQKGKLEALRKGLVGDGSGALVEYQVPSRERLPILMHTAWHEAINFALMDGKDVGDDPLIDVICLSVLAADGGYILIDDVQQEGIQKAISLLARLPGWNKVGEAGQRSVLYRKD